MVIHVNDLVKENGQFLSQNEFENRYNTNTNFIQFQCIIHAIKDYARKHGIINFTKNLKMPLQNFPDNTKIIPLRLSVSSSNKTRHCQAIRESLQDNPFFLCCFIYMYVFIYLRLTHCN